MDFTYKNLRDALLSKDFSLLKNEFENELIDVKRYPYNLDTDHGKEELCKDVSAMLNNQGGFIVLGVRGEADSNHPFERIKEVVGVDAVVNEQQYIQCLKNGMYPEAPFVSIKETELDGEKIFYIEIPDGDHKPFFRKKGADFQYWVRTGSHATQQDISRLHEISKKGLDYESHIVKIEKNVEQLVQLAKNGLRTPSSLSNLKKQL